MKIALPIFICQFRFYNWIGEYLQPFGIPRAKDLWDLRSARETINDYIYKRAFYLVPEEIFRVEEQKQNQSETIKNLSISIKPLHGDKYSFSVCVLCVCLCVYVYMRGFSFWYFFLKKRLQNTEMTRQINFSNRKFKRLIWASVRNKGRGYWNRYCRIM
jgi:hypothetical protein